MEKIYTNWSKATINATEAISGLLSCVEAGKNAWIEVGQNGDQDFPIKKKNPQLDNPFNWTMMYGIPKNEKEMEKYNYFNETEKDLTYNWTACYGTDEAIELYQKTGKITKDLCMSMGRCNPVKISDANEYRRSITKDNYEYSYWVTFWQPKDKIPYWIVDTDIKDVFVVCYNDETVNKKSAIAKAGEFLIKYAEKINP